MFIKQELNVVLLNGMNDCLIITTPKYFVTEADF